LLHASTNWIQTLIQDKKWLPNTGYPNTALHLGPFIAAKSHAPTCDISNMKCVVCLFAKASAQSTPNMVPRPLLKPHTLKSNHLTPGDCVSADHYFSPVPSCLSHTFGKECVGYTCGSLFVDHASGKIFNFPQYSNNANKTIQCAQRLESMARDEGFRIKAYHSDNGVFAAADFQEYCKQQQQKFSFSGVGAKHQNGIAERNIKTVAQWACANMLHLATHWPAEAHKRYWPQAIDYAVWVFNRLPNSTSGISPNKPWSRCDMLTMNFVAPMFLDALCMCLMCRFRMERNYPSQILGLV
jgi:hypothetical protein